MASILILGEAGQLACALRALPWPGNAQVTSLGRRSLGAPAEAAPAAAAAIRQAQPLLVLNAAAYTAVDRAEAEPTLAHALNAALPQAAGQACAELRIPFVHVSSDYVFDGEKPGAYVETDAPNPLSVYGASKLAGDRAVAAVAAEHGGLERWAILRTSWVFSAIGDSFPHKLLRRARNGEVLRVVDDQVGCPTTAAALAGAMRAIGLRLLDREPTATGLFNYCGAAAMSWHGFARLLLDAAGRAGLDVPPLQPISSAEFPTPAQRPRRSVLDCGKIGRQCGLPAPAIDGELDGIVRAILAG